MIKKILLTLLSLVGLALVVILGLAATKPNTYRVERKSTIAAEPSTIFGVVNDFHRWPEWSPWENLDPQMKRTFEGPESGTGASYAWLGNDQVGQGKMTITESTPSDRIALRLEFIKPWAATNDVQFQFTPGDAGTDVAWTMNGNNNFMSKVMGVFMNMDQMIGKDFEAGLESMKTLAESEQTTINSNRQAAPPPIKREEPLAN